MNELTLEQTDKIARFVSRHNIVFSHLCDDLIDHICCDLEDSIKRGESFDKAFSELRVSLGNESLTNIQKDTLYAVDSKYRKMRNMIKISGVAGTILLGIATVFKIQHLPFAGVMMFLGALILIFLFLPSSLMVLWKESKSAKRLFLFISGFLASALFISGVLFKIQHWPGSSIVITIGMLIAILMFTPALIRDQLSNPDQTIPRWVFYFGGLAMALYGAGFLLKIMHWPAGGILLMVSIILLALLILPAYFYYRWGKDETVSIEGIIFIASLLLFLVPSTLINFNSSHNFENLFLESSILSNKGLEYRAVRNNALLKKTPIVETDLINMLHKETQALINQIDEIENRFLKPDNYESVRLLFDQEESSVPDLEKQLLAYSNFLARLNEGESSNSPGAMLDLNLYLPLMTENTESVPHNSPLALIQSLQVLKGSILDAEELTIRKLSNNSNTTNQ